MKIIFNGNTTRARAMRIRRKYKRSKVRTMVTLRSFRYFVQFLLFTHLLISFADFASYTSSISSGLCHWVHRTGLNIQRENIICKH